MARKRASRKQVAQRKKFAKIAKFCAKRARRGIEKYQKCMKRKLKK